MTLASDHPRSAWLSRVAFGLALSIVVARCLMNETAREPGFGTVAAPAGPGATTSLILDWLSGVPAMLVLVRRLVDRSFTLRWTWAHAALLSLALWALLSVTWADDQFLTLVTAPRLLAAATLFWAFAQVVRRWDQFRIVAGVLVGLLLANVAQGVLFRTLDYPDIQEYWKQNKAQILVEHNWREGEYSAVRFEQKLLAGEVLGFNASPNTLGAIVVMMALVAIGCAAQRCGDRDEPGWPGLLIIAAASSLYLLYFTGSKASYGALLLGLVALAGWRLMRRWLDSHRALVFAAGGASVLLAVVAVIAVGLSQGGLPDDSLNFRWRYWTGAWKLLLVDPIRGVGWSNFADHYLATRVPAAAEEINDPHNLFVKIAVELGFVGLLLGIAWLAFWAWRASARVAMHVSPTEKVEGVHRLTTVRSPFPAIGLLATAGCAFVLCVVTAVDFGASTGGGAAYVLLELMRRVLFIGLIGLGVGIVCVYSSRDPIVDERPAPWIRAAMFLGVAILVLQSAIDITFFQIGPLMLAVMTMGALVGLAQQDKTPKRDSLAMIGLIVGLVLGLVMASVVVGPVAVAESKAAAAREATAAGRIDLAARNAAAAFESGSFVSNYDYALDAATAYQQLAITSPDPERRTANAAEASRWFERAVEANAASTQARLGRARWRATTAKDAAAADASIADYTAATALNPNDVELRIEFADILERFGKKAAAAQQLSAALKINDQFDSAEPERIELRSPARLTDLQARLAKLSAP